jgi:hypothetical protein
VHSAAQPSLPRVVFLLASVSAWPIVRAMPRAMCDTGSPASPWTPMTSPTTPWRALAPLPSSLCRQHPPLTRPSLPSPWIHRPRSHHAPHAQPQCPRAPTLPAMPSTPTNASSAPLHRRQHHRLQPSATGTPPTIPVPSAALVPHRAFFVLHGEL